MDRRKESGQAIIEYIILLTIVLGSIVYFVRKMTDFMDTGTASNGGKIEVQLRTGHAPATIWTK